MPPDQITEEAHQRAVERIREVVYQHRVGHFQVECRVLDVGTKRYQRGTSPNTENSALASPTDAPA